jgi:hypothetical protein
MHRPPHTAWSNCSRSARRARTIRRTTGSTRSLRTGTLKNRFATLHAAQCLGRSCGRCVNGARACLRHNHAFGRRRGHCRRCGSNYRLGSWYVDWRSYRTGNRRLFHGRRRRRWHFNGRGRSLRHACRCWSQAGGCGGCRFRLLRSILCGHRDNRGCTCQSRRRRLHDYETLRRARSDGRGRCWRRRHNLWSLSRQGDNFPWSGFRSCGGTGRYRMNRRCARRGSGEYRLTARRHSSRRTGCRRRNGRFRGSCRGSGHGGSRGCSGYAAMCSLRFPLFFLLLDGAQNISRLGNVRQINFGLLLDRSGPARRIGRGFSPTAQGSAHTLGLVFFNRTGVRLLFGDSHFREYVENHSAFDFQLSC